MAHKNITTIEGLAEMIQRTMASKEDIKDVREDIANVNGRLDRIEHLLIEEQRRKIENLETRMKKLEDALAV
jgi:DNA-binding FrmR family transcriptional regulator